jgi:protein-disulfide isomerase
MSMKKTILLLVFTSLLVQQATQAESLDDIGDNIFEKKVLEVIMKHPDVIEKSMTLYVEKKRKEQEAEKLSDSLNNRYEVDYGDSPSLGNKKAKYHLVVFTDFECPYCKRGDETVQALKEKYGDDLYVIQKNYPLAFHKNAKPAAKAALAAHEQGKFFEYSSKLFDNQKKLDQEIYLDLAKDLKLDINQFKKDMNSEKIEKQLDKDIEIASTVKVSSTPNFILNGVKIAGAYPIDYFEKIIAMLDLEMAEKE